MNDLDLLREQMGLAKPVQKKTAKRGRPKSQTERLITEVQAPDPNDPNCGAKASGLDPLPQTRGRNSAVTAKWDHIPLPPETIYEYVDDPEAVGKTVDKSGRVTIRLKKK